MRHRWAVVAGWLVATVLALVFLPTIGSVVDNNSAAFLPADAPSVQATRLAKPFLVGVPQTGTIVAVADTGALTPADDRAVDRIEQLVSGRSGVTSVRVAATSSDQQARTVVVEFSAATAGGGPVGVGAVDDVRAVMARQDIPGLSLYLTGPLPELVDQQSAAHHTANKAELLSAIFILVLLILAFRSMLAPLVTLVPPVLALALASPVIAESTHLGVRISSLMELLLTALVLGAGTDYGLFLVFRYRENLRLGLDPRQAVVAAVEKVGESITFSAATVIAALLTLLLASFGLYRGVGPGLAIGIFIVLLIALTFFPALLAIVGRAMFWPTPVRPGPPRAGRWGRVAARVSSRPVTALTIGTLALGGLAAALVAYAPSGFDAGGYISGSNSALGEQAIETHFGPSALDDTDVLVRLAEPVWRRPEVIATAQLALDRSGEFASVSSALDAGGLALPPGVLAAAYRRLGPPGDLPANPPAGSHVPLVLYDAYRASADSISSDGRTLLYRVSLTAGGASSTAALQAIPAVRDAVGRVADRVGAVGYGVAGRAATAADVSAISAADIFEIAPLVVVVLALLLALVLRSLVAPLYLVASVGLSYLASLGLAVAIFVLLGGELGVNFTLPFFMFIFIMALGEDYNILVMSRIREEAAVLPLRAAVAKALGTTGTTVTSAGLVLAGTFGVLVVTTSGQIRQIGAGLALGILLDTFVVRTLLVPSAVVLLGRWNWWPSSMSRRDRTGSPGPTDRDRPGGLQAGVSPTGP